MCLDVLIFDSIPVEGNDTFQSEIEAHGGPRSASIWLDPPHVDFHWGSSPGYVKSFLYVQVCYSIYRQTDQVQKKGMAFSMAWTSSKKSLQCFWHYNT